MRNRQHTEDSTMVLALVACALALSDTLKGHSPAYDGKPFALVVKVPDELESDFEQAALQILKMQPELGDIEVATPPKSYHGKSDFSDVEAALRASKRTLVLVGEDVKLPKFLIIAADAICTVRPIDADLLAKSVRNAHDRVLEPETAERLMSYPISDVLTAIRQDRSFDDVLRRLEEAERAAGGNDDVPLVEDLSGYGAATDWARDLVTDLGHWRSGAIPWTDIDAGLLLSGPPGVGKTLFARSIAKSCGASFVASSIAQWQATGHLGDMLRAMRSTFKDAAGKAPCILLLDEIDSIGDRTRFTGHNAQYSTEVVAALLECLDGALRREGVIVIGACNHPDRLDDALLRPGRLGTHIRIGLPDRAARAGILLTHLGSALTSNEVARIAEASDEFSGADIAQLAKNARRRARRNGETLTVDDVLAELPPLIPIDGALRDRICVHEAGHVAVGLTLQVGKMINVIVRDGFRNGVAVGGGAVFETGDNLPAAKSYLADIATQLAGIAAELVFFGDHLDGSGGVEGSDLQQAADLATMIVAQFGMGGLLNHFSARSSEDRERIRRTVPGINRRVEEMLAAELERAKEIVTRMSPFISELAALLNQDGSVDGDRARALFVAMGGSDAA